MSSLTEAMENWVGFVNAFKLKLVDLHKKLMCSSILCDAESHHWSGDKEFYEVSCQPEFKELLHYVIFSHIF